MPVVLQGLLQQGWNILRAPSNGRLAANRQKLILRAGNRELAFRLSFFAVTDSARNRPHERRIEITTTYARGLKPDPVFRDAVIGFERSQQTYVGVDPRRLFHGGPTANASTFFSVSGLEWTRPDRILVLPYPSLLFGGTEYHAFFSVDRFAEYLFNLDHIHAGAYTGTGPFSQPPQGRRRSSSRLTVADDAATGDCLILEFPTASPPSRARLSDQILVAFESGEPPKPRRRRISAEDFAEIQRRRDENGLLGEQFVLQQERLRLTQARRFDLASQIEWVSRDSVGEGYDIKSFETNGEDRLVEVKATLGKSRTFEMTEREWQMAEASGDQYWIYRVFQVRSRQPRVEHVQNPIRLETTAQLVRTPSGWRVTIS